MSNPEVHSSITVQAPAAAVFAILADPRQHERIDGSGTLRGTVSGPERLVLGSEFGMSMKQGAPYKIKNTVVEHEEDRLIAWRHKGLHRWRYELAPAAGGGCEVTETWDISRYPAPVRAIFRALFAKRTQTAIEATLVNLKAAAEADAVDRSGGQ
ncbi:Polyketide cyclase / dehydrase and lipid transport [Nocardioides dokdonensis FR1436]|uniref:Polyketide cyclase / dehydrase and lipid transport n=1 Tax=Nocardioides dokdonensis FR1436 TaxID=1300347 RepID=A0A1A9GHF4_9ACTN|nr:SRPBCC family protein [Nocardioides dokdonensis]ANH37496.1 Polyketide cyclase / dehydrase and lipid transport [Nocardioides dokdonensis FR1436]